MFIQNLSSQKIQSVSVGCFIPVACGRDSADRAVLPAAASSVAGTRRWFHTASRDMRNLRTRLRPRSRWPKWSPGASSHGALAEFFFEGLGKCGETVEKMLESVGRFHIFKFQSIWKIHAQSWNKCSSMENHWKCWNLREVRERKIHLKPFPQIPLCSWIILISLKCSAIFKGKSQNCHQHFCWGRKNTVTRCHIIFI